MFAVELFNQIPRINRNPIQFQELSDRTMQNAQPQFLLLFKQAYFLSEVIIICFLLATSKYLLILFTELNSRDFKKNEEEGKESGQADEKTL